MVNDVYLEAVRKKQKIGIWGMGDYLHNVINKIDPSLPICGICDRDTLKYGEKIVCGGKELYCTSFEELAEKGAELIMAATRSVKTVAEIQEAVGDRGIHVCHIQEAVKAYKEEWEREQIRKYDLAMQRVSEPADTGKIRCFVSITVPVNRCNLSCSYCYVGQHRDFYEKETVLYSTEFVKRALSRKRLQGSALLNFCGSGETFLCRQLADMIEALLDEGHYISIITNGLIETPLKRLLSHRHSDRLFFKCSFHYLELKKRGLLDKFCENVRMIRDSRASFSVELVPHDELIPYIDEIKEFSVRHFGAAVHVTVARNEEKDGYPVLTDLAEEDYVKTWRRFDSELFEIKMRHQNREHGYCIAGAGTFLMDLEHGGTSFCPNNGRLSNIYDDISSPIRYKPIGNGCRSRYCINSHAYLSLGMIPELNECTYYDVRNRRCEDGTDWVKETMRQVMTQKICDNIR